MKKLNKKDYIYLLIIIISFILLIFCLSNTSYIFGSNSTWNSNYYPIPDYFRTLFYSTKDLLPDFAFNIGNGQNIYNLSYYGLLSPIILISYILPSIKMSTYITVSTIICIIISTILLYKFLYNKKYNSEICFITSFIFIMSSSISFHTHKDITFINYMPFLILGLFGVDKKFDFNKGWLLTLSVFLMIMTSYYFSIGGILCLFIYTFYRYLNHMKKVTFKTFLKTFLNVLIPIIVAILCSAILTLPTIAAIISNKIDFSLILKTLYVSDITIDKLLYSPYGLGLTAIIIPAIINLFRKNKANIILSIILICIVLFSKNIISLNILIPLLPLYLYAIAEFLKDIFLKKINLKSIIIFFLLISIFIYFYKYNLLRFSVDTLILFIAILLFYKTSNKTLFMILLISFTIINSYTINNNDSLILKYTTEENEINLKNSLNLILENDETFYRINNNINTLEYTNNILGNINYYNSTIDSLIYNQQFKEFNKLFNNGNNPTTNLLFLIFNNNKYIISRYKPLQGYELISSNNGLNIYRNNNVLPLGFATSNVMSYEDFDKLNDIIKQEALLNVIVSDTNTKNDFVPSTKKITLNYNKILKHENIIAQENKSISVNTKDKIQIEYKLPKKYRNKIIFIKFKVNGKRKQDLSIKINNVQNNNNDNFTYILSSTNQDKLIFTLSEGEYKLYDFETYILDYAYIENITKNLDKFIVDKRETKGDIIKGNINVIEDGYFMLSIPYDKGFNIKVDNKQVNYEIVDNSFIGFKITEGNHDIEIEYKAPMKNISLVITSFGIIFFIVISYFESKRQF